MYFIALVSIYCMGIGQVVSLPDGKWAPLDIIQYGPQAEILL